MSTDYSAKIRDHLTKQRRQASAPGGTCMYRVTRGNCALMCAVGCLIPDDKYDNIIEGVVMHSIDYYLNSDDRLNVKRATALRDALPAGLNHIEARYWQKYHDGACTLYKPDGTHGPEFNYVRWCDNDMPADSPAAFYDALKIHMADLAEVHHGDA